MWGILRLTLEGGIACRAESSALRRFALGSSGVSEVSRAFSDRLLLYIHRPPLWKTAIGGGTTQGDVLEVTTNRRAPPATSSRRPHGHGDQKVSAIRRELFHWEELRARGYPPNHFNTP